MLSLTLFENRLFTIIAETACFALCIPLGKLPLEVHKWKGEPL